MSLAEEFESYSVGNKRLLKDFQHRNDGIMPDYIEGTVQAINIGDSKSSTI